MGQSNTKKIKKIKKVKKIKKTIVIPPKQNGKRKIANVILKDGQDKKIIKAISKLSKIMVGDYELRISIQMKDHESIITTDEKVSIDFIEQLTEVFPEITINTEDSQ